MDGLTLGFLETLETPQVDSGPQTTSPSDTSPSEKDLSWYDRVPEILAIIVMAAFIGEVIHIATQHRLWF